MKQTSEESAWYEEWFDRAEYDLVYKRRDATDARRLLDTILHLTGVEPGARVLDMACGRGRHSIELARRGYVVTGIDLSPRAIATAREAAKAQSLSVEFQVGDMRDAPCDSCFDLVVNLFTSFGYFDEDEHSERAVGAMAASLKAGARLVQDFLNGAYWSKHFVPYDERTEDGLLLKQRRWIEDGRLNKEITLVGSDGLSRSYTESVRLFGLDDFRRMHAGAGLRVEHVLGDSDGRPFAEDSKRLIVISRRHAGD